MKSKKTEVDMRVVGSPIVLSTMRKDEYAFVGTGFAEFSKGDGVMTTGTINKDGEGTAVEEVRNEWWHDMEAILPFSPRVFVHGPPGTGKTTYGFRYAKSKGQAVYSITLNEDVSAQEVLGHFINRGGDTVWHDGPAIRAWKEGAMLIINEIAEANDEVLTALYGILDDPEIAQVTLPSGATVRPAEGFRVIATSNEPPNALPEALDDRFTVKVNASKPTEEAISALPMSVQSMVRASYNSIEKGAASSQLITYRKAAGFGDLVKRGVDCEIAARVVFGVRAEEILTAWKLEN